MILSHRMALSLVAQGRPDPGLREAEAAMTRMLRTTTTRVRVQSAGLTKMLGSMREAAHRAAVPVARGPSKAIQQRGSASVPLAAQRSTGPEARRIGEGRMPGNSMLAWWAASRLPAVAPVSPASKPRQPLQVPWNRRAQVTARADRLASIPPLRPLGRMTHAAATLDALAMAVQPLRSRPQVAAHLPAAIGAAREATFPARAGFAGRSVAAVAATPGTARSSPAGSSSSMLRAVGTAGTVPRHAGSLLSASRWSAGAPRPGLATGQGHLGVAAAKAVGAGPGAVPTRATSLLAMQTSAAAVPVVASGATVADLQRQVIPPANTTRRSATTASPVPMRPDDAYQPRPAAGQQASEGRSTTASPAIVVNLTGDVVMDGRRLGLLTAASQARDASLPAHGQSRVNLRAVPIYSGAQIPR